MNARSSWNLLAALSLVSGFGYANVSAQTAADSEKKEESVKLEKFEVTGSRVKRLDTETPAPVVSYSIKDIEAKGYTNIGDFIQSLPFNTGSSNSIYQTASFTRGGATANIRGLGSQRFLVLVNGRRAVTYALTNSGNRSVFDFNSLPAAAIESVEYLKDGASAIYGSDAITGVLNIKLKKNYTGLSTSAYYGNTIGHDTALKQFSVVAGAGTGKTRAMVAFDYKNSHSNFLPDYGITNTDYTALFGTNKGLNQNSTLNFPANVTISSAQAAAIRTALGLTTFATGNYVITGGQPTGNPTLASFSNVGVIPNENRYNFAPVAQIYPAYDYMSGYAQVEHEFNEKLSAFGEVMFSDNRTYYAFTPGVVSFSTEGLSLPANSPFNPFGIALTTLLGRTSFGAVRKFDTESISANFLGGLRGNIMDRWDWETAVSYGFNQVTSVSRNAIRATTYQAALNGTLSGFTGQFFNPFGPSASSALQQALFTSSTSSNKSEAFSVDGNVTGTLFTLPGGDVGVAAGFEFRNDRLQTNPDTAAYLGSGGGLPLKGERDVTSGYVEITAPVYRNTPVGSAEVQLAGRYENYSDFGSTTKPKIGAKFRLPDNKIANVLLRASYSESFQAPALGLLYASQTVGFTGVTADPLRPQDPPQQLRVVTGGNPNLLPETAKSSYVGIVVDIPAVKDLSFSVDFFKIRINQVIVTPSANFLLSARGLAQFPNGVVRDNTVGNPGPILFLASVPSNNSAAFQLYRGLDFKIDYRLRKTRFGDFNFGAEATRILEIGSDSGLGGGYFDNVGLYNNPKWRGNASTSWSLKDWSAAVSADVIGPFFNDGFTAAGWGENPYTLVSASVSYRGFFGATFTLGATNALDNRPPVNGRVLTGFDQNTYGAGALGRFIYVRVRKDF